MKIKNTAIAVITTICLCSGQLLAQKSNYSEIIAKKADQIEQKVIDWRRDIHQNPELGNREIRTAAIVAKHLESLGMEVKTEVGITGVIGILKGGLPGPVVALRADMDALPVTERTPVPFASKVKAVYNGNETGVMHACGHDVHVAILMGVAEILTGMKNELKGTVKFIFQPAEEGAPKGEEGGAELMVKEGALDNPKVDVIFGLHIIAQVEVGKITYRPGGMFAGVADMKITVKGKSSHGAEPWSSIDPIVTSAQIINNLQTIISRNVKITENAAVVTIGAIHGGNRSNIIPEQVEMLGTVRTLSESDEQLIFERIRQIATKTAEANGAEAIVELPYSSHYPVTFNNLELTAKMLPTLKKAAGESNVILVPAETGAEDFSFFANEVPGLYFNIGGLPKGKDPETSAPHHTPEFFLDESGFVTGINAMVNLVVDYMEMEK
ncbi:amidohydrolase [Marivirga salinae]|uniref:Amidohydrolase n=1 Tax=Marivirga salinarum TaxID=3059078 RepID=A0AA51RDT5_9BACT|nr:amidohydrolase [Marivirga sp. BDSF4-3]WMN11054.1 amidohydrolase [Marivirga sp. BDSF4-3]